MNRNQLHPIISHSTGIFLYLAMVVLAGCGGVESQKSEAVRGIPSANSQKQVSPGSGKMPIPFDIAIQAALNGHTDTIQQALDTGTNPNQLDENGRTMLMVAAFNGHSAIVDKLLKAGTQINARDLAGRTALMFAATGTSVETVELLLKNKAEVNLVDGEEQFSALMFAAAEGNRDVVELLIKFGADSNLKDVDGETAASFARDNGHTELADYLENLVR